MSFQRYAFIYLFIFAHLNGEKFNSPEIQTSLELNLIKNVNLTLSLLIASSSSFPFFSPPPDTPPEC